MNRRKAEFEPTKLERQVEVELAYMVDGDYRLHGFEIRRLVEVAVTRRFVSLKEADLYRVSDRYKLRLEREQNRWQKFLAKAVVKAA